MAPISRGFLLSTALCMALAACGGGGSMGGGMGGGGASAPGGIEPIPPVAPQVQAGMDAWVAAFRPRAAAAGISPATIARALEAVPYNPKAVEAARNQAEFQKSLWEYLDSGVSESRVRLGRAELARRAGLFADLETRYGVDGAAVAAIWGIESNFGASKGRMLVIPALASLAHAGYRAGFFESQLIGALKILDSGDIDPGHLTGSWAGAMGHTQFIPTSYLAFAVDHTGDGRRDIWSEDPSDALASTAAYLARSGWTRGQPALVEVVLPEGFDTALTGKGTRRGTADWAAMGVRRADGGALGAYGPASILLPEGRSGPALMIFDNFRAILRYNNADSYAIAVGHLANRLAGGGEFTREFRRDPNLLDEAERIELQQRLSAQGYDTGGTDGRTGAMTRAAVSAFQSAAGLPVDGYPDRDVLEALRRR